jgi:hypothetical protein
MRMQDFMRKAVMVSEPMQGFNYALILMCGPDFHSFVYRIKGLNPFLPYFRRSRVRLPAAAYASSRACHHFDILEIIKVP